MCIRVFIPIPISRALSFVYALMGQLHSKHSLHFGQLSRPRASARAYAEVNYDHHLATLTIEPFHRMQFRNGIFLGRYSMLCQRHVHARAHSPSPFPRLIVHVCSYRPSTLEALISSRSTSSSPCRAGACASTEVNSNHDLSTLTIESSIPSCVHIAMQFTLRNAAMGQHLQCEA